MKNDENNNVLMLDTVGGTNNCYDKQIRKKTEREKNYNIYSLHMCIINIFLDVILNIVRVEYEDFSRYLTSHSRCSTITTTLGKTETEVS